MARVSDAIMIGAGRNGLTTGFVSDLYLSTATTVLALATR